MIEQIVYIAMIVVAALLVIAILAIIFQFLRLNKYSENAVLERWAQGLNDQGNLKSGFLNMVEAKFKSKDLKYKYYRKKIPLSTSSKLQQEYIVCKMDEDISCYIGCIAEGNDLIINWLIYDNVQRGIYKAPIIGWMLIAAFKKHSFALNNKISAFASVTLDAVIKVTEEIMEENELDISTLNRKSSGKLGPL